MLRRLPEIGVDFVDTADSYGPNVSEELIREALAPYDRIVVATKAGLTRTGPEPLDPARAAGISDPAGACEPSPARRRDHRPLAVAPHRPRSAARRAIRRDQVADRRQGDPPCRPERSLGRGDRGGARGCFPVATVQNKYNLGDRASESRARLLRAARHRLHPVVSAGGGRTVATRRRARPHRRRRIGDARARSRSPGC